MSHRPLRVVMIVRLFHPWVGGMERQAMKLAMALQSQGVEVRILTGRWFRGTRRNEFIDGIRVTRHHTLWEGFGVRGLRRIGGVMYMVTLAVHLILHRREYDVIHVHGLSYHAYVAVKVGHKLGKPVVVKLANSGVASDIVKMREGRHLPLTRLMLPTALRADRLVALNPLSADELSEQGVMTGSIARIPNGVELGDTVRDFGIGDPAVLLFVGRLHEQKAVDVLLRAMAVLSASIPAELIVAGDGPERSDLERLVVELGIDEVVHFLGMVDDIDAELQRADVLVLPSRAEGLSNTLLEAMACSLPVVASCITANRNLIEEGRTGRLFRLDDADDLAKVLRGLLEDDVARAEIGLAGRKLVEDTYSVEQVAAEYRILYGAMLLERKVA